MKRKPTLDELIRSEQAEAARVRRFLDGHDVSGDAPLWIAPGVPSHYNALQLAKMFGIERGRVTTRHATQVNGNHVTLATMNCTRGSFSRIGAAASRDPDVAIELAYRNSVRQLIPQEGVKLAWQDKQSEAVRYA